MPKSERIKGKRPKIAGRRSGRQSNAPKFYGDHASPDQLQEADDWVARNYPPTDFSDLDWLPSVPGRPTPFRTTWWETYGGLTVSKKRGVKFSIGCEEGCGKLIRMNGKFQELNAKSTPHGELRKPPVCHGVSWAAIKVMLEDMELKESKKLRQEKKFTEEFKRSACWHHSNLHPGHNGCNAAGAKTTSSNVSASEKEQALGLILRTMKEYEGTGVWQS